MEASRRQSVDKKLLSLLPIVLLRDQKYQKSSKRFPLRNLPVISHLPKRAQRLGSVSAQTSCTPAVSFIRKEFKRGKPSSFCPFRTFRTSEKYFILHVLLYDQKYQKSSKTFPLRYLPASPRFAKAQTIYTLPCEHIERTALPWVKAEVQAQKHGLSARLCRCHADIRQGFPLC